ncbi:hypothetical protein B0T21DRAFT_184724 [Apiosordaria backusii]|uniref:DUF676 domain-containing protein n=1 Tax=Apiosordaria backusii TaxID=314023 RepID=A0AA40EEE2_9PEZI|nr:hypothetical protein B0T21DRAFT_184724 [Apiosordaria backusii]
MDQTKTASSKEANGSSGTSRTLDPAGHSQQLPLDTEPAPRPNASQPSQPTASKSTLTPIPTPDVPNGGKGGSLQPVKNKTPVITSSQVSADSNAHLASQSPAAPAKDTPPVKDTPPQADIKQKNTAGTTAKSKSAQAPGGLPELERIEQKYLGLRQLVAPSDEMEEIEADIVFVHGIAAHPHGTWTHKDTKVNWLEDKSMLPADLPKARILYFGYQSAWYGQNAVRQTVNTAADQLLNSLMGRLRENCAERPIIFVAHCFGGLIVQRAFHIAHSHRSNFPGLIDAITGLIFLGTPHSGVDGNSALSTQGDIYQAIVSAQVNTHVETLEAMTHNNQMLHGIVQDFNTVLKNEVKVKPQIYSFYEMYSSNVGKIGGMGNIPQEFVVTESSATLYGYGSTGLNANHFNMNTFENNQDANYDSVRQQIMKMAKQSRENQEQRKEAGKGMSYQGVSALVRTWGRGTPDF